MNARELADLFASGKAYVACNGEELLDDATAREADALAARATSLLAAAEANDGTTAETDIARAIDQLNLVAVGLEPTFSVSAKWVKGAIALIEALRNERNGLAARVVELEPDAERYRFIRDEDNWCDDGPVTWAMLGELSHAEFDAAIDAARGSKP